MPRTGVNLRASQDLHVTGGSLFPNENENKMCFNPFKIFTSYLYKLFLNSSVLALSPCPYVKTLGRPKICSALQLKVFVCRNEIKDIKLIRILKDIHVIIIYRKTLITEFRVTLFSRGNHSVFINKALFS